MTENNEANQITANALTRKRRDILFEIGEAEKRIERLRTELVHLDAVLRMFRPNFAAENIPIKHRNRTLSPYFAHGELTRRIYDVLREQDTVSSRDVADRAMRDKGLDPTTDPRTRTDFVRRVTIQLGDMGRKGKLERIGKGPALRWRLSN